MLGAMSPKPQLAALRAEVQAYEARARRKINRLARVNHARIAGTANDPRRDPALVKRYTSRQLEAYKASLASFNSRATQFHADAYGRVVSSSAYQEYKAVERRYNASKDSFYKPYARLKNANGVTIGERMAMVTPTHRNMVQEVNAPYRDIERKAFNFADAASMRRMTKHLQEKIDKGWGHQISESRKQFEAMAEAVGQPELIDAARSLNDKQFAGLWYYSGFARYMSEQYAVYQMLLADKRGAWMTQIQERALSDAKAEIKQAKKWRL